MVRPLDPDNPNARILKQDHEGEDLGEPALPVVHSLAEALEMDQHPEYDPAQTRLPKLVLMN